MVKFIILLLVLGIAGYFLVAMGLILSQKPHAQLTPTKLSFEAVQNQTPAPVPVEVFTYADGWVGDIRYQASGRTNAPLLVMLHGSGWYGQQFDAVFASFGDAADLLAPDLRGHGPTPERRGDVDFIGQFEEDIAQLITAKRKAGQKVILLGHSSGGGLVIRMAGGVHGSLIDHAFLLAPYIHHIAPTMRKNAGEWSHPLTRRIIGLSMLNAVGVRFFNGMTVMQFAMPSNVLKGPLGGYATLAYSYRLNTGYAPRNAYVRDIERLPPFDVIAGKEDEAFEAAAYPQVFDPVLSRGSVHLLDGVGHLDLVHDPRTWEIIRARLWVGLVALSKGL